MSIAEQRVAKCGANVCIHSASGAHLCNAWLLSKGTRRYRSAARYCLDLLQALPAEMHTPLSLTEAGPTYALDSRGRRLMKRWNGHRAADQTYWQYPGPNGILCQDARPIKSASLAEMTSLVPRIFLCCVERIPQHCARNEGPWIIAPCGASRFKGPDEPADQ